MADYAPELTEEQRIMFEWMRQCEVQHLFPTLMLAVEVFDVKGNQVMDGNRSHLFVSADLPPTILKLTLQALIDRLGEADFDLAIWPLP